jgi:hypothetical protein
MRQVKIHSKYVSGLTRVELKAYGMVLMIKALFENSTLYENRDIMAKLKLLACENTIRTLLSVAERKGMIVYHNGNITCVSFSKLMRAHNLNPVKCKLIEITSEHTLKDVMDILRAEIIKDNINQQETKIRLTDKLNARNCDMSLKQTKKALKIIAKFKPSVIETRKIFVTSRKTAQWLGVSNATAVTILKRLNDKGLISIVRQIDKRYFKEKLDPKFIENLKTQVLGYKYIFNNILYIDRGYCYINTTINKTVRH